MRLDALCHGTPAGLRPGRWLRLWSCWRWSAAPLFGRGQRLSPPPHCRFPCLPGSRLEPPEAVSSLALTHDGSQIAFVATFEGRNRLWVRPLNSATAQPLPGTEDARMPFWSPDGRSLGFFATGRLLRIDPAGGPPQVICAASVDTAPSWGPDDTILFAQTPDAAQQRSGGVYRVSARGGAVTQVTVVDRSKGESEHYWPSFLPDGVHFFYVATVAEEGRDRRHVVFVGSTADATVTRVAEVESRMTYSPTGHVLYGQDGALLARPFDLRTYQLTGDPVSIAERLWYYRPTGLAQYAISDTGVLAYHGGPSLSELVWLDRTGRRIGTMGTSGSYNDVRISPNGREVAVVVVDSRSGSSDISIFDRESGIPTRFTSDPGGASRPVWSTGGDVLFYRMAGANGPPDIYQKRADGRGRHEVRLALDGIQQPMDASSDGRYLVYNDANRATIRDIWLLPLLPPGAPRPYLATTAVEQDARVSPDSRWVAFVSSESGKAEVYVAPIDDSSARRRVSTDGGLAPRWGPGGRELVYLDLNDTLMAMTFASGPAMRNGRPRPLFSAGRLFRNPGGGFGEPYYDLAPDGQSFLVNRLVHDSAVEPINVVLNWPSLIGK
jgi:eukaryotic-like serine/threonine-protein kinase